MGAIEALGEKGSHPEGRAEAPHLPLFHSEEMVRWQEFRPLPLLVLCLRSQNSPNTFSLSGDCASWRATLAADIFSKPGSGSRGVQFLSPPLRWHASLGDELGQSTRSVHRRWCQLRPQVTINVPCSQVNATETTPTLGTGQTTCRGLAGVLINTFYSAVFDCVDC